MTLFKSFFIKHRIRRFRSNTSGIAAVEFGLFVPILLIMTFGAFEVARALIIHKRFERATAMVGDLVAREHTLWPSDPDEPGYIPDAQVKSSDAKSSLAGILSAVSKVMYPYSSSPLKIRVYQGWAKMSDPTQIVVEWSYEYPSEVTAGCGTEKKTITTGLLQGGGRGIFVESSYDYKPMLKNLLPKTITDATWKNTMVLTPRDVPSVLFLPALNNSNTWDSPSKAPCQ